MTAQSDLLSRIGRSCGECYACCVALGIEDLKKWPGQTCKHLDGTIPDKRCTIYGTRPPACSNYYCAWLAGMGSPDERPNLSGILVTVYPPFPYDKTILGYDPGPDQSRYCATVHVMDIDKIGDLQSETSNISKVTRYLIEDGCNDIRVLSNGNKPGASMLHFHNGVIRTGNILKPDKGGYEQLDFVTRNPPVGLYLMVNQSEYQQLKEKEIAR